MVLKGVFFVNGAFELCVLGAHVAEPAPLMTMTMTILIWRVFCFAGTFTRHLVPTRFFNTAPVVSKVVRALRQKIC